MIRLFEKYIQLSWFVGDYTASLDYLPNFWTCTKGQQVRTEWCPRVATFNPALRPLTYTLVKFVHPDILAWFLVCWVKKVSKWQQFCTDFICIQAMFVKNMFYCHFVPCFVPNMWLFSGVFNSISNRMYWRWEYIT